MANRLTRHIPNTITCLNLFSGCVGCVMAFNHQYDLALAAILCSAVFDFFDGMSARALDAHSIIGKDIDSLADDISFGFVPSAIVFSLLQERMLLSGEQGLVSTALPYAAFLIAVFSALRLAKFNNDTRQTTSFIGLAVPANALFWASLVAGLHDSLATAPSYMTPCLIIGILVSSWLLVSEIPMFSLKFKSLSWADNKVRFIFLIGCVPLLAVFGRLGFALIIIWYILLAVFEWLTSKTSNQHA